MLPCPLSSLSSPLHFQSPPSSGFPSAGCYITPQLSLSFYCVYLSPSQVFSACYVVLPLCLYPFLIPCLVFLCLVSLIFFLSLYMAISLFPILYLPNLYSPSNHSLYFHLFFHLIQLQPIYGPIALSIANVHVNTDSSDIIS